VGSRITRFIAAAACFSLVCDPLAAADATNHWAFKVITPTELPHLKSPAAVRNAIDAFVLARLEEKGLAFAAPASRRVLIRRLFLDMLGLPPQPEEVERFLQDTSPDAYERLVDRVLASPHYGERWGRHWLDVVRFAETHGFETNTPRDNAWPYRDSVIRAFNHDKPYTDFILEQLAGDQFGVDEATGFLVAGPWDEVKSPDVVLTANQRADELHDMVSVTGSAFLGLTIGCARCHDHKFDPIPQTDYFAIKAALAGVQHGERKLKTPDHERRLEQARHLRQKLNEIEAELTCFEIIADPARNVPLRPPVQPRVNVDRFTSVEARFVRFVVTETTALEPCLDELEIYSDEPKPRNVALASAGARATASSVYPNSSLHRLEHVNDGLYGNAHSWISSETGQGWVQIELPARARINKVVWGRDREEKYKDRLATAYRIEAGLDTNEWRVVAGSNDRYAINAGSKAASPTNGLSATEAQQLERLLVTRRQIESQIKDLTQAPMVYAGRFTKPEPTHRLHRGDPMAKKEVVEPGALTRIGRKLEMKPESIEAQRRLALAGWIADGSNPLTARVMVNRIWQYHFGRGLVETSSDFGLNGARPTHPELLDWLASEFMAGGWRPKIIHRLILLSTTYRQSSASSARGLETDTDNRLLWRYPPRRLEAEVIRDSMLWVSGALDLRMGGPGYHVFEPNNNYVRVYNPKLTFGPGEWRRMVYQYKPRMQQDATFGAFDCPDGGQIAPRRFASITPLQALNLLNSGFVLQQAELFAERLSHERTVSEQARRAFLLAFSREPSKDELSAASSLIEEQGMAAFGRAIFNASEFLYMF
jgi:hypothetical protein